MTPEVIGNEYLVLGMVEKKVWKGSLKGSSNQPDEVLKHTADFKKVLDVKVEPGGWYPAYKKKA